jgi:hypothetical protein
VTLKQTLGGLLALFAVGCKEPMANDPGYRATVLCNQKMHGRSSAGKGTRNDAKALCIGRVGDQFRAGASEPPDALADCILDAPDEKAAAACK